jgi:uncharacterized protein YkwD
VHFPVSTRHSLRRPALTAILLVALTVPIAAPTLATGGSTFVSLTNDKRTSVGLGPVALSSAVDQIAVERANQMARADTMAHDLQYVGRRLGELGVCWSSVGEIIAWEKGYPTYSYQRTVDAWWASSGHHAIMVGNYNVAGGSWATSASGANLSAMVFVKTCAGTGDRTPPTISLRSPASGATGVSLTQAVTVRFSEAVTGVGSPSFVLRDAVTGTALAAYVTYDPATRTAVLKPVGAYGLGRWYKVALSGSIRDAAGNSLAYTTWSFRATTTQTFNPVRTLAFNAGKHVGYKFSSTGAVLASKAYTLVRSSTASTSKRAVIAGHGGTWFYVTNGVWAGYWLQASTYIRLI